MTIRSPNIPRSIAPCACTAQSAAVHGFIEEAAEPWGMYLAEERVRGALRWIELAISLRAGGTIAVRVFVRGRRIHARIVPPGADADHPALVLGCWMTPRAAMAEVPELAALVRAILAADARLPKWLKDEVNALESKIESFRRGSAPSPAFESKIESKVESRVGSRLGPKTREPVSSPSLEDAFAAPS